jgi:membrane protein DedA with SNARE-associated domain
MPSRFFSEVFAALINFNTIRHNSLLFSSRPGLVIEQNREMAASIASFLLNKIQALPSLLVYVTVSLLVFGESALFLGFVLPGETSVLIGGVVASEGHVNIYLLAALVVSAAIVGDSVGYVIGRRYGRRLFQLPLVRTRIPLLERTLTGLRKKGRRYVFAARFTAFLRAVMPGLAGISEMPYGQFLVSNALGGVVWGVLYCILGYLAGTAIKQVEHYSNVGEAIMLVLFASVVTFLVLRHRKREAKRLAEPTTSEEP